MKDEKDLRELVSDAASILSEAAQREDTQGFIIVACNPTVGFNAACKGNPLVMKGCVRHLYEYSPVISRAINQVVVGAPNPADYVTERTAKKMKECGVYIGSSYIYITDENPKFNHVRGKLCSLREVLYTFVEDTGLYRAPSLWEAIRWFRQAKDLSIEVYTNACGYNWQLSRANRTMCCGSRLDDSCCHFDDEGMNDGGAYETYEEALNAALYHACQYIVKELS